MSILSGQDHHQLRSFLISEQVLDACKNILQPDRNTCNSLSAIFQELRLFPHVYKCNYQSNI